MRLANHTNISTKRIKEIIRFVRPPGISNFDVRVSNSNIHTFYGRAYSAGSPFHNRDVWFIVVRITRKDSRFPLYIDRSPKERTLSIERSVATTVVNKMSSRGYISCLWLSREECLVHLIAHELRHLWQYKMKKGRRVWGSKGKMSERDADAYAIHKTREWRRLQNKRQSIGDMYG